MNKQITRPLREAKSSGQANSVAESNPTPQNNKQASGVMDKPKKKHRRGLKITIVVALAVVAIGGGMLLAYFDVFKTSEKQAESEMTMEEFFAQEGDTSFDLLDKAYEEGKLDKETSLIYGAYAAFGDERLPEEYRSEVMAFEANHVFAGIQENYDGFSSENKEIIDPFLKRPDEEGSWWSQKMARQAGYNPDLVETAHAKGRPDYWQYIDTADGKFRIWYKYGSIPILSPIISRFTSKPRAEKVKKIIDSSGVYKQFKDLLKRDAINDGKLGGDGRIDIYITLDELRGRRGKHYIGLTMPDKSKSKTSAYIIINGTNQSLVVHEIFHVFQFAFDHKISDIVWMEATATWAEDFMFESANSEHYKLKYYFPYPEKEYSSFGGLFEYGAYILPYFISRTSGDDKIREIWEGCEKMSCIKSVDENIDGGFKKQWRKFTLWNYNKSPVKFYDDQGGFPDISSAKIQLPQHKYSIQGNKIDISSTQLMPLSANFAEAKNELEEGKYKKVVFDNLETFTSMSDKLAIEAIVYPKDGDPYVDKKDWSKINKRTFCLEKPKENFDRIVLVFSNGGIGKEGTFAESSSYGGSITARPQEESCYTIDQEDQRTAKIEMDEMAKGLATTPTVDSAIKVKTEGKLVESAKQEVRYGYQSKWEAKLDYEEQWSSYNFKATPIDTCAVNPGKTTHTANFKFDLSSVKDGDAVTIEASDLNVHYDPWQSICTIAGIT
ncbi:MAG: hypothetical protein ABII72_04990, partial [Parcubacteria group bacterium]